MRDEVTRSPRGHAANVPGCIGIVGIPFLVAGVAIVAVRLASDEGHLVTFSIGLCFLTAGAILIRWAVQSQVARRRLERSRAEHPNEPWLWDHPWTFPILRVPAVAHLAGTLWGLLFLTLFLTPFNVLAPFPASIIVWVFDALALGGWGYLAYQVLQGVKYGDSYLRLLRLPFFLGETLDVRLGGAGRVSGFRTLKVTLRCLEEHVERTQSAGKSQGVWKVFTRHEEVREVPREEVGALGRPARLFSLAREADETTELALSFALPSDPTLKTELASPEPRYWELEVTADVPGIDFKVAFLVPVYAR